MSRDVEAYFAQSKSLPVSLVLVLPLLMAYEAGMLLLKSRVVNHAGALVRQMVSLIGLDAWLVVTAGVAGLFVLALLLKMNGRSKKFSLYVLMILEAAFYGVLLGPIAASLEGHAAGLASPGAGGQPVVLTILLYIGAGVWEEIVFRLVLLGGGIFVLVRGLKGDRIVFTVLMLLVSGLAFSLFHHIGPLGEPFDGRVFLFRTLAGIALGIVYLTRGLGICVYTHAFYNVSRFLFPLF